MILAVQCTQRASEDWAAREVVSRVEGSVAGGQQPPCPEPRDEARG